MSTKELLAEYNKLLSKLEHINNTLQELNTVDVPQLIDKIRLVERKMGIVCTSFKSSVYVIAQQNEEQELLQQQQQQQQEQLQLQQLQQQSHTDHQQWEQQQHQQAQNFTYSGDNHSPEGNNSEQHQHYHFQQQEGQSQQEPDQQELPQRKSFQPDHDEEGVIFEDQERAQQQQPPQRTPYQPSYSSIRQSSLFRSSIRPRMSLSQFSSQQQRLQQQQQQPPNQQKIHSLHQQQDAEPSSQPAYQSIFSQSRGLGSRWTSNRDGETNRPRY